MKNNPLRFTGLDDLPVVKQAKASIVEAELRRRSRAELKRIGGKALKILIVVAMFVALVVTVASLSRGAEAAEVEGQFEILSVLTENAGADSWSSKGIAFGGVNVGWGHFGIRGNVGISKEFDAGFIGEAGFFARLGRGEVLLAAGYMNGRQAPEAEKDPMIYYRAAGFLRVFTWDETDFEVVGGVRFLDLDAPDSDLQAFAGVAWRGR